MNKMCFLKLFFKKNNNNNVKLKLKPLYNPFENEVFQDIFIVDKYSINIELPCVCTNIDKNVIFIENYFLSK